MATKEKSLMTIEVLNILAWYKQARADADHTAKLNSLPIKLQWAIKKNMDKLMPLQKSYEEVKNDLETEIRDEYFGEEKSFETTQEQNGEQVSARQVKDEYLEEYNEKVKEVNQKLQDLLVQTNEIDVTVVDLDDIIDNMADSISLTMDDLDILSFMAD